MSLILRQAGCLQQDLLGWSIDGDRDVAALEFRSGRSIDYYRRTFRFDSFKQDVEQFHVAHGGLHHFGVLLHAIGGHLEAGCQALGGDQVVGIHKQK